MHTAHQRADVLQYYRAPELIFGATDYSCSIGKWISRHAPPVWDIDDAPRPLLRYLVSWVCSCRTVARATNLPWRQWGGSAGGDYQGPGHAHQRADQRDEPKLYQIQIPSNQTPSLLKGQLPYMETIWY